MINDNYDNFNNLKILSMVCRNCKKDLPEEQFELYPTGTRRKVCRHCHYELHTKKGRRKWVMKQRARITTLFVKSCGPYDPYDP